MALTRGAAGQSSGLGRVPGRLPSGRPFRLAAVVFDFDGTLTRPGGIDFSAVHEEVGCPDGVGLLEFLELIDDLGIRARKEAVLVEAEMAAAALCEPNLGALELITVLREAEIPMAIITRNRHQAVERALLDLEGIDEDDFACIVTRDQPLSPKPSPDGVVHVARELDVEIGELLLVGDHAYDIEAGARAGALTMFLDNGRANLADEVVTDSDFVVSDLRQALEVIRYGLPLRSGKLPKHLLEEGLLGVEAGGSVLVGAAIGEDAAAVDVSGYEILVLASDPVTLTSVEAAKYLVAVNANDVAACGASPRWLLATLLFPVGVSGAEVLAFIHDLRETCREQEIDLVGGHTEVTDAVSRLVAVGTVVGIADSSRLLDKRRMQQGDRILLTKGVAVEGTGLLAREFGSRLLKAGIASAEVADCTKFLEKIGILDEARIARGISGVSALHDVTEGGLATAIRELGQAGGHRLCVNTESIPYYPETKKFCDALSLESLGLIGSGSLLITCSAVDAPRLAEALDAEHIEVTDIGEVLGEGEGVQALVDGEPAEWPVFERDEINRLHA